MNKIGIGALAACALACLPAPAFAAPPAATAASDTDAQAAAKAARMQWFADAKFGIFIHYGIYDVDGVEESWSFFDEKIPYADYMQQLKGFTAAHYDPQAWADLIKASGAKYAVLTSKHHDGVALWETKQGLNVVKDTPAHRDLVAPFVKALRKDGLKVGLYYSLIDWSSPDYPAFTKTRTRYEIKNDPARWNRFVVYYQSQLRDLMDRYNPDLYWFDGGWEHSAAEWHSRQTRDMIFAHNPNAIINSRLPGYGDYGTPEQGVPIRRPPDKYWELCMTINNSWGWQPQDHDFKTPDELIRILADTLGMGGNLLLDIGPRADGTIPQEEVSTLKEIGR
ncbi:MAG: alpha-L-fucosidase, partial [Xanthomonadaceae bacterium]|nr:alpha-L-fucosidase [Xanthomonadaceae bacterium]